jgi:hypothetical protein
MVWVLAGGDGLGTVGRLKNGNWLRWNAAIQRNGLVSQNSVFQTTLDWDFGVLSGYV